MLNYYEFVASPHDTLIKNIDDATIKKIAKILTNKKLIVQNIKDRHIDLFLAECKKDNSLESFFKNDFYTKARDEQRMSKKAPGKSLGEEIIQFALPIDEFGSFRDKWNGKKFETIHLTEKEIISNFNYFKKNNTKKFLRRGKIKIPIDFGMYGAYFVFLGIPILFFLILMQIEITWMKEVCFGSSSPDWFDKGDKKFLRDMNVSTTMNCGQVVTGFSYPNAFKACLAFGLGIIILFGFPIVDDIKGPASNKITTVLMLLIIWIIFSFVLYFLTWFTLMGVFEILPERYSGI